VAAKKNPGSEVLNGALVVLGGLLMLIPGFITGRPSARSLLLPPTPRPGPAAFLVRKPPEFAFVVSATQFRRPATPTTSTQPPPTSTSRSCTRDPTPLARVRRRRRCCVGRGRGMPDGARGGHAVLGAGDDTTVLEARLEAGAGRWRFRGSSATGLELVLAPWSPATASSARGGNADTRRRRALARRPRPGWRRSTRRRPADKLESVRNAGSVVSGDDEALSVLALRPRKAPGPRRTMWLSAALVEAGAVQDRLGPAVVDHVHGRGPGLRRGRGRAVGEASRPRSPGPSTSTRTARRGEGRGAHPPAGARAGLELEVQPFPLAQPRTRRRGCVPPRAVRDGPRFGRSSATFGGVLTSPLLDSFASFQNSSGISLEQLGRAEMAAVAQRDGANPAVRARDREALRVPVPPDARPLS